MTMADVPPDLALLARAAMKNEIFAQIVSCKSFTIGESGAQTERRLSNHNRLLNLYDGAVGVKTGYTKSSGRCLVGAAEREGVTLIAVTLDDPDDWNDHEAMFDYGFGNYGVVTLCEAGQCTYDVDVTGGIAHSVKCSNVSGVSVVLPKSVPAGEVELTVEYPRFLYAPVGRSQYAGRIVYRYKGEIVGCSSLAAEEEVPARIYKKSFAEIIAGMFAR